MTELFVNILNMSITASYLILAVLLLRILAKRIPQKYICLLWILAAIRLVVPFELESAVSLIPSGRTITKEIMTDYVPQIDSGIKVVDSTLNAAMTNAGATTTASANPMQIYMGILSIIWVAGIAVMLLLCVISYVRLDYRLVNAKPQQGRIYRCDEITTPFVLGIFKPKIYLPSSIDEEFDHVVAHEEVHIRRFDHVTKPLAYLILMLHWFNPLVWVGFIMYCRDVELACDERVVREMTVEERKEYASALLHCSVKQSVLSICPLAFGEIGVRSRISKVLHFSKPTKAILSLTAAITAIIVICFMTNPTSLATSGIKVDKNLDAAISRCLLLEQYNNDGQTECSAEGHVVLGTEKTGSSTKVYVIVSTGQYGFFDNKFLQKRVSNPIPAVIYLTENSEGYLYQTIDYPVDEYGYEKSLKEIFPPNLQKEALNGQKYYSTIKKQKEAYARIYLDRQGRTAEVGDYSDFTLKSMTDYDFPIEVINFLNEKYTDYDTWLGPSERLIDKVRHVYQVSTDGSHTITYHHYLKDSKKTVEKSIVTISVRGKKAYIDCLNESTGNNEHYEIALKDDYVYQRQ